MSAPWSMLGDIQAFVELGGTVIWALLFACLLMWMLILERIWFMRISWPTQARRIVSQWEMRDDRISWKALKIREELISDVDMALHALLPMIKTIVALCPLLGLLGTVIGMIGVFDVLAISGNDDAQAMARGVYKATIPTMAGLVVALTGIYFTIRLDQRAERETSRLADKLTLQT
jgi:biopolymer transport protein ExbB